MHLKFPLNGNPLGKTRFGVTFQGPMTRFPTFLRRCGQAADVHLSDPSSQDFMLGSLDARGLVLSETALIDVDAATMIKGSCHCGAVHWEMDAVPESATACNCTACRRYGALWAYDFDGEAIRVSGPTKAYIRGCSLGFHFCAECGCVAYWKGLHADKEGRRRIAVNLRLTDPGAIAHVLIDHFEGLEKFDDLPRDGKCIRDYWF